MKPLSFAALFTTALLANSGVAQSGIVSRPTDEFSAAQASKAQSKADALVAFRNGDTASGLTKVTASVARNKGGSNETLLIGNQLAEISLALKAERNFVRAGEVATLSITRLAAARAGLPPKAAAATYVLSAHIYESVFNDPHQAIQAYEQAVALAPEDKAAAYRLAYLKGVEEHTRKRAAEDELLRQRAAKTKR